MSAGILITPGHEEGAEKIEEGCRKSPRPKPRRGKSGKRLITAVEARRRAERHVSKRMFQGVPVRDGKTARWRVYDLTGKLAGKDVWLVYQNSPVKYGGGEGS